MGQPNAQDFSTIFQGFEDIFGDVSGIFDSFFGGGGSRRRSSSSRGQRGSDLRYDMEITFLEAAFGVKKEVTYARAERCDACKGTGADKGSGRKLCPDVRGLGPGPQELRVLLHRLHLPELQRGRGDHREALRRVPRSRDGAQVAHHHHHHPGGHRRRQTPEPLRPGRRRVQTAPRTATCTSSCGCSRTRASSGTARTCTARSPISITQAALGAEIVVPTLDQKTARVAVPPGTQNGRVLRLKGEGIPELHAPGRRGDMYVKIVVRIPTKLNAKARELLKELASSNGDDSNPKPIPLSELKQN